MQAAVVVGWRKGMTSASFTYVLEVVDEQLWFGHLGKGGAHWEPGTPILISGSISSDLSWTAENRAHRDGVKIGKAAGQVVLNKFLEEISLNFERYRTIGRPALADSKRTWTTTRAAFGANLELVDKMPRSGPPAMAGLGPFIKGTQEGKECFVAVTPDATLSAEELFALLS